MQPKDLGHPVVNLWTQIKHDQVVNKTKLGGYHRQLKSNHGDEKLPGLMKARFKTRHCHCTVKKLEKIVTWTRLLFRGRVTLYGPFFLLKDFSRWIFLVLDRSNTISIDDLHGLKCYLRSSLDISGHPFATAQGALKTTYDQC